MQALSFPFRDGCSPSVFFSAAPLSPAASILSRFCRPAPPAADKEETRGSDPRVGVRRAFCAREKRAQAGNRGWGWGRAGMLRYRIEGRGVGSHVGDSWVVQRVISTAHDTHTPLLMLRITTSSVFSLSVTFRSEAGLAKKNCAHEKRNIIANTGGLMSCV